MQWFSGFGGGDLRTEFIDDLPVIAVQGILNHHKRMGIALAEQIVRFMNFVCCIHGYQHGTDPGTGPECDIPCRNIRRPDRHFGAGADPEGNQSACKTVHIVPEFCIGARVVQRGIFECILVREFLRHTVKYLAERFVNQLVLFPDIAACPVKIEIK